MQTFNKPYRVRKEGGIFSSIIGALIGILFVVIASPLALWYAESQHRSEDFATAQVVESDSTTDGYVVVEGDAVVTETVSCPDVLRGHGNTNTAEATPENCVYVEKITEQYSVERKEQCDSVTNNQVEIEYRGQECDSDGSNCKPCYLVDEYSWDQTTSESTYAKFSMGSYNVKASDQTNFIGTQDYTHYETEPTTLNGTNTNTTVNTNTTTTTRTPEGYTVGDVRHIYTYFPASAVALVAGDAKGQAISGAIDGKPFVVSNTGYAGTLAELESQDRNTAWGLRISSLALMVVGVMMIFGPLTAFTNLFRMIPIIGRRIDNGFDAVIKFFAAVIGFILWLAVYAIVMVLKNIWIIIIVLGLIGIGVLFLVKRGKKSAGTSAPATPQQPPATPPQV